MSDILTAERGYIYEWENPNADRFGIIRKNLCVVISAPHRSKDRLVSILFLSTDRGERGSDIVPLKFNHENWIVRTDLITYTNRDYLTQKVGNVQNSIMKQIENGVLSGLGFDTSIDWEKMYNQLLNQVVNSRR